MHRSRTGEAVDGSFRSVPVELIRRGRHQPRRIVEESALEELAHSVRSRGIVQPIVVRPTGNGGFEIVAGERRWRAAQMAGLNEVPVVVRECSDSEAAAVALIENIQREDLNPMEEAEGYRTLAGEFGLTHQELADTVGRSRSSVSNTLRLLELNRDVRALVEQGELDMGHARALLALSGAEQSETAAEVVRRGLSARETEKLVRSKAKGDDGRYRSEVARPRRGQARDRAGRAPRREGAHRPQDEGQGLGHHPLQLARGPRRDPAANPVGAVRPVATGHGRPEEQFSLCVAPGKSTRSADATPGSAGVSPA